MVLLCLLMLVSLINNVFSSEHEKIYSSCNDAYVKACEPETGEYSIKTQTDLGYSQVFCRMEDYFDCDGSAGWTLVLKIYQEEMSEPTFVYNSSYWTNKESFMPEEGVHNIEESETKLPTYWSTPFTEICMENFDASEAITITGYQSPSMYHAIADGKNRPSNITLTSWKKLGELSVDDSQVKCIEQGFNIGGNSSDSSRARFGIFISNVTDGCHQPTHWVGVGVDFTNAGGGQKTTNAGSYNGAYVPITVHIYVR